MEKSDILNNAKFNETKENIWMMIESYFKDKHLENLVRHQLESYNNFEQTAAELAIENNYQYVICGHIHQPQQRVVTTDKGSVTYLNSGDWIENLTSLEYFDNAWRLYQYDPKQFEETNKKSKIIQLQEELSVITQEVAFQVSM